MLQRGEVTPFVVVGILLLAIVGFLLWSRSYILDQETSNLVVLPSEADRLRVQVEACLDEATRAAIASSALQGGYLRDPGDSYLFALDEPPTTLVIPYYLTGREARVPPLPTIARHVSSGIEAEIRSCLSPAQIPFEIEGYYAGLRVETVINEGSVHAEMRLPISAKKGGTEFLFETFTTDIPTEYASFHQLAIALTEEQKKHPESLCITCITTLAGAYGMEVTSVETEDKGSRVLLYFLTSPETEDPVRAYAFAHKFI